MAELPKISTQTNQTEEKVCNYIQLHVHSYQK